MPLTTKTRTSSPSFARILRTRSRAAFLAAHGRAASLAYEAEVDSVLDGLAGHIAASPDVDALLALAQRKAKRA